MSAGQAKETLRDVQSRHTEILSLEADVQELRDLFVDMSVLVHDQVNYCNVSCISPAACVIFCTRLYVILVHEGRLYTKHGSAEYRIMSKIWYFSQGMLKV